MDSSLLNQLLELHIPLNEAKVYLVLLEVGQTSAGELIKRTGLHRSVVYESLDRLTDKKLVYKLTKQNIAHFQATDPERILQRTRREQKIAETLLPKLRGLAEAGSSEIVVHEGLEAYRRFWIESALSLPKGSVDYVAGSVGKTWQEYLGEDLDLFRKIRAEREIKWKMIIFDKDEVEMEWQKRHPRLHEYRIIDRNVAKNGNFNIFNQDSLILHSVTEPLIIEVKNKTLVGVFQNLFDILWETGKKL